MIIIFYVMDSLRPDFLSCYGHPRETSPHLDALAKDGAVFMNAFAQSTWTRPSGASLLSSTYPSVHGVQSMDGRLPESIPSLPKIFREKGFKTFGISTMGNISRAYGFANGFDLYAELYKDTALAGKRQILAVDDATLLSDLGLEGGYVTFATSEDINDCAIPVMRENRDKNLFIFIWSIDTHDPYFHRDKGLSRFSAPSDRILWGPGVVNMRSDSEREDLKALYEDMVFYNDHHIGRLIEELKDLGVYDDTLLVVTGDHGEAFGEHGANSHAGLPFDEQVRVPLMIKFPRSEHAGKKIDALVQHIDIGQTICDYMESEGVGSMPQRETGALLQGKSMLPLLSGEESINDFVWCDTQAPGKGSKRYVGVRTRDYKYIECLTPSETPLPHEGSLMRRLFKGREGATPQQMLFSLKDDPKESSDVSRLEKKVLEHFRTLAADILGENQDIAKRFAERGREKPELDEQTARQLKALGYFE